MARPKAVIDPEQVEKLAAIGCKTKEIAAWFGVTDDTIRNRFSAEIEKGRANLKMSLRRKQIEVALKGNVSMLIWLGKILLEQVERREITADDSGFKIVIDNYIAKRKQIEGE